MNVEKGELIGTVLAFEHTRRFTTVQVKHPREHGKVWVNVWKDGERRGTYFADPRPPAETAEGDLSVVEADPMIDEPGLDPDILEQDFLTDEEVEKQSVHSSTTTSSSCESVEQDDATSVDYDPDDAKPQMKRRRVLRVRRRKPEPSEHPLTKENIDRVVKEMCREEVIVKIGRAHV